MFHGNLETLLAELQNNYTNRTTIFGRYSKYIINWKTSLFFNYSYAFGNQQQLQQERLITFLNRNYTIGTTINAKLSSKITTDYKASFFFYLSKSQLQQTSSVITFANQAFSLNYFPTEKLIFKASAEHYYFKNNFSSSRNYFFADINLRYKPPKSKIDYDLAYQNIFNTKTFISGLLLNNVETISEYQIRPRQILLKVNVYF